MKNIDNKQNKKDKEKDKEIEIKKKIKMRGKIQLFHFENFFKLYKIDIKDTIDRIQYINDEDIIKIYENNIDNNKYSNVIFLNHSNKEDALTFIKLFIEKAEENCAAKNNSDYPIMVFFERESFTKEILYSHYLNSTKESNISRFYDLKSHNIFFIKDTKESIEDLLTKDITNYYYEFDFKSDINKLNKYKIEMLFMGQTGCGKSTFINYLLGKLRAFSASMNNFKSLGGIYTHTSYPISIKDSEGFEVNSEAQQKKIFEILEKNFEEELNNRTHIAFYLIPGPYNSNRDLDYSCINSLIKLELYNIHYYLIMTKDPEEGKHFQKASIRFLNGIINNNDFQKINVKMDEEKLKNILENMKDKLKQRIFSVDVSKRESKTIAPLLEQIYEDLKVEKANNESFIKDLQIKKQKVSTFQIDFSGSQIKDNENNFKIPTSLENSPFFNLKKFKNDNRKRQQAEEIIKEAQNVSSIRKLFFCYNSKIVDNRKKMLEKILEIYESKHLTIDLLEGQLSNEEKNEWFYQHDCTEKLGNKIIDICHEEYKKRDIADKYIDYCVGFNRSIDDFGRYIDEFTKFELDGIKIPYDCELKVK